MTPDRVIRLGQPGGSFCLQLSQRIQHLWMVLMVKTYHKIFPFWCCLPEQSLYSYILSTFASIVSPFDEQHADSHLAVTWNKVSLPGACKLFLSEIDEDEDSLLRRLVSLSSVLGRSQSLCAIRGFTLAFVSTLASSLSELGMKMRYLLLGQSVVRFSVCFGLRNGMLLQVKLFDPASSAITRYAV